MEHIEQLRQLGKPELAVAVSQLVRDVMCPEGKWTLERGRDCVEVLLIATRMAFPTSVEIDSIGKNDTITDTAVKLADEIDVIKEEARQADEERP